MPYELSERDIQVRIQCGCGTCLDYLRRNGYDFNNVTQFKQTEIILSKSQKYWDSMTPKQRVDFMAYLSTRVKMRYFLEDITYWSKKDFNNIIGTSFCDEYKTKFYLDRLNLRGFSV